MSSQHDSDGGLMAIRSFTQLNTFIQQVMVHQLNKLRWCVLTVVFMMLVLIPFISLYQNYHASRAYDFLQPDEKMIYDVINVLTTVMVDDSNSMGEIIGSTWSAHIGSFKLSDPLAVLNQIFIRWRVPMDFMMSGVFAIVITIIFGRVFCGWICPASFIYELNSNLSAYINRKLHKQYGIQLRTWKFSRSVKYYILFSGLILSTCSGLMILGALYPPAIVGREIYYGIAVDGMTYSAAFFFMTLLFDTFISRRMFCRYLCPGGALYSLLGRFRLFRIQRDVARCNDCRKCNAVCEFGLTPMRDQFGQECTNCTACISACPTKALTLQITMRDQQNQGMGKLARSNLKMITTDRLVG